MQENNLSHENQSLKKVSGMYQDWFLDYASYVILERAVPSIYDGLKPVQRRILHSMRELEDGRYNKVANIVGNTMKYHPHGDASITDAMVQIGQKELLIDTQGNWGNIFTGDSAAAARYIEARLTPFALEVVFNPKTTVWQKSYDGRNNEPVDLPVKFPLLLSQGVEGIAVGLSTKILPHNFNELIDASIAYLKHENFQLFPDFLTGGSIDVSNYNDGHRGGKVRIRAKIQQTDKHQLTILDIPFGTNTSSLIDSVIKANEKGKIKIKKIEDNTAENVEINIQLAPDVSPDKMIDALYAFTDCEISVSPNACVITDNKPEFLTVSDILRKNTDFTVKLLKTELEIELYELQESWHFVSLEKIFIENRIYHDIEEQETWEGVIHAIDEGLKPHTQHLLREVTEEDIIRLTEIRIKRISKFDLNKAQEQLLALEGKIEQVKHHLKHLIAYSITYFSEIKRKYGKGRERKTEIKLFDTIDATNVAVANVKFYVNREEGFIGISLKKDEYVFDCSDIDDVIIFRKDGIMKITKVENKTFVGAGVLHVGIFKKNDNRTIYNLIYRDGKLGPWFMKRFPVTSITRDKEYDLTQGKKHSEIIYFSANANGEAEVAQVILKPNPRLKKFRLDIDFSELSVRSRDTKGNLVTKFPIKKVELKEEGISTLAPRKIWFDDSIKRLNIEERGTFLGEFKGSDKIVLLNINGEAKLVNFDLQNRFDDEYLILEKWQEEKPITCVYFDGEKEKYFVKRFLLDDTNNIQSFFIKEHQNSFIEWIGIADLVKVTITFIEENGKRRPSEFIQLHDFITVKGIKAQGNQLTKYNIEKLDFEIENLELTTEISDQVHFIIDESPKNNSDNSFDGGIQGVFNFDV